MATFQLIICGGEVKALKLTILRPVSEEILAWAKGGSVVMLFALSSSPIQLI